MLALQRGRPLWLRGLKFRIASYSTEGSESGKIDTSGTDSDEFSQQSTDHKDKLIFDSILDSVLMRAENKANHGKPRLVTSTIQALFDKPKENPLDRAYRSILDNRTSDLATVTRESGRESKYVLENAEPVLEQISRLQTNKEVIDYYKTVIVPSFTTTKWAQKPTAAGPVVNQETIAYITKHTIEVLVDEFKDPSGALNVFQYVKSQSIDCFTAACSAGVYNRIIALRWQYYRDIQSVITLVNEMFINAVRGNNETVDLLGLITREAIESSQNIPTADAMPLWTPRDDKLVRTINSYRVRVMSALAGRRDFSLTDLKM